MVLCTGSTLAAGQQKKVPALLHIFICLSLLSFIPFTAQAATPRIAAGVEHAVALKSNGTVWAWGSNTVGQLGNGGNTDETTPIAVKAENAIFGNLSSVTAIAAGESHSMALKSGGTVLAWGANTFGELGDGISVGGTAATPVTVSGITSGSAVAAGADHSVALVNGVVYTWGDNFYGQLGNSTDVGSHVAHATPAPVTITGSPTITAIAAGSDFTLALDSLGNVWAWGHNNNGQLGNGTIIDSATPVNVLSGVKSISAGLGSSVQHALAVKTTGTVWAWGKGTSGQLGGSVDSPTPIQVGTLSSMSTVSAGGFHSVALKGDGTVWSWGADASGQLGDGGTSQSTVPLQASGFTGGSAIAAGEYFTVALTSSGAVWTWGDNSSGQLGNGITTPFGTANSTPAAIGFSLSGTCSPPSGLLKGTSPLNAVDALMALRIAVKLDPQTPAALAVGDMNCDGKIDAVDALLILRKSVGLPIQ